jgi:uncharacterized membrane protein
VQIYDGADDDGSQGVDGAWVPSDIYFGDVYGPGSQFSSWDDNGDDIFGQWLGGMSGWAMDDPDYHLDVYIGRLPGSDGVEIGVMVDKIVTYENGTDWDWFFKAGLAAVDPFINNPYDPNDVPESEVSLDLIGDLLQPKGFALTKMYETQGTLSPTAVNNAINGGLGIMMFSGHGSYTAWGSETALYYDTSYIPNLNNGIMLPIGSQSACLTGGFDNEDTTHHPNPGVGDAMAERFVKKHEGGFITDVASTRIAWVAVGEWFPYYGMGYLHRMYAKAIADGQMTPGKMLNKARNDYITQFGTTGGAGDYKHMAEVNLFGDPSLAFGGIGLEVTTEDGHKQVAPGASQNYTFTVKNVGNWDVTASLRASFDGGPWTTELSRSSLALAVGEEGTVELKVTANPNALANTKGKFTLFATSSKNSRSASAEATATVWQVFGLELTTDLDHKAGLPGSDVTFDLVVKNMGNGNDGASLAAEDVPDGWGVYLPKEHVDLTAYNSVGASVTVSLPGQVVAGSYWFNVSGALDGANITKRVTLRVDVEAVHDIDLACQECSKSVDPGEVVDFKLDLTNLGNVHEDVEVTITVPNGWGASVAQSSYHLGPYASTEVDIDITAASKALAEDYDVTVKATIPGEEVEVDLVINVNRIYGLELRVTTPSAIVEDGAEASFAAVVENTGNGPEDIEITCLKEPKDWYSQGQPSTFSIAAFETYPIDFYVRTFRGELAGDYEVEMQIEGQAGPKIKDTAVLKVQVAERIDGSAELDETLQSEYPGRAVTNRVRYDNNGNVWENVSLESPTAGDLLVSLSNKETKVDPARSGLLTFTVNVAMDALAGRHDYIVWAVTDKGTNISLNGTVNVLQVYGFDLEVDPAGYEVERGDDLVKKVTVKNTGNGEDTFLVQVSDDSGWTRASEKGFTLAPGESKVFYLDIQPPSNAAPEYHEVMVTVTSECGAERDGMADYKVTAQQEVSIESSGVLWFPLIIILLVITLIAAKGAVQTRSKGPGSRRRSPRPEDWDRL